MSTIGDLIGYGESETEAIVVFNEIGKRNGPMGRYRTLVVFPERGGAIPEFGRSYYCYLRKDPKGNIYWASIKTEVTLDSILALNKDLKNELAEIILEEHPEAFKSEITTLQIKDYENKIKEKYKAENAALRSKIEHLENELSKLSEIGRKELMLMPDDSDIGVSNGFLHDVSLKDGEYAVRMDLRKSKALFIRCDGGEYYCTSGYINIAPLLSKYHVTKAVCRHCEELDGALLTFRG
jgi:hypothetical protein